MPTKTRILIASISSEALFGIEDMLAGVRDYSLQTRMLDASRPDPLQGVVERPDVLLLRLDGKSAAALDALAARPAAERPPVIVIGDLGHPESMRAAMRGGARDFLVEPVQQEELRTSIGRLVAEEVTTRAGGNCRITAFVNAKGGSGATFLACNIAHLFASASSMRTVLLDLDLQFGALSRYLDIEPKRSLLEALDIAGDLDATAVTAYLMRHESGLAVLAGVKDNAMLQQELMTDRFEMVLSLLTASFERLVVDVPRHVEPFGALVLERADHVVLVLQQSVPSLHDGARMYEFLTRGLALPDERISIAVNRYHKAASVGLSDIEHAFPGRPLVCLPNDYRAVAESINMGVPMYQFARRSPVTKALLQLERQLGGRAAETGRSFLNSLRRTG